MHRAVHANDAAYDGLFFVAVRSTRIFCRPSCRSRPAKPANRAFYATAEDAQAAGYRACKRCRPLDCDGRPPDWVQGLLAAVDEEPNNRWPDAVLRARGIEPARARRFFRQWFGMTFQDYSRRRRMGQALVELRRGANIDRVALGNGYESHSGFREAFGRTFGGPPGQRRHDGLIVTAQIASPIGMLSVGATDEGICLLEFEPRSSAAETWLGKHFGRAVVPGQHPLLEQLRDELAAYFSGSLREFTVPVVAPGTPFQKSVWSALRAIPYGETRSYADIARQIRRRAAVRAVGQANGRNRVAIVIPCHRVVNSGGQLGGYGGGLWRKQYMLDLERG
jgi:AraC family transcriptional regulator of adaptative response/methylated-DNA-[protein]-cysteine methyltransferase